MSYDITCAQCKAPVTHECRRHRTGSDEEGNPIWRSTLEARDALHPNPLVHALIGLFNWRPEQGLPAATVEAMKKSDWYDAGDEDAPFLSQAVLYPLLGGKHDGRSFFAYLHEIARAAGFDSHAIKSLARAARTSEKLGDAPRRGGLVMLKTMNEAGLVPEVGWTVGLIADGVGLIVAPVSAIVPNDRPGGPRGDWDHWVRFEGGGSCHFLRLLRVAVWIKNTEGEVVWPPPAPEKVEL